MMKTCERKVVSVAMLALLSLAALAPVASAAPRVQLNGQPLNTTETPVKMHNRVLVPMRDIFEALGATVDWNGATRDITAISGNKRVWLQIGNRNASVNGNGVLLDQAPIVRSGSTFVPLRFVSESMGANVQWNESLQLVSITTGGTVGSGSAVAGARHIAVPAGAVVPVTLDQELSSATARKGDAFSTTVRSERVGDSEFPPGTKIIGVVNDVTQRTDSQPGAIDISFRTVVLPDNRTLPVEGSLISLDSESVDRPSTGRIVAKPEKGKSTNTKTILIGAAAGYLLGKVLLDKNAILSAALGAAAGYLYGNRSGDKQTNTDVSVKAGTLLGVRLQRSVSYADASGYYDQRLPYLSQS